MALVTVQRSPTPSTTSSPCASSSYLEDSESAALLCCECGESEIFSDFNEADSGEEECRSQPRSISESFLTVKGAALFLPRGNGSSTPRISHRRNKHAGDLQQHLQAMFILLRPEDNIRLAVRLESTYQNRTRYMVVVSTNGRQDTEESIVLGMDFSSNDSTCTMGLVLPLWSDTLIHLDGDGGFSVSTDNRVHIFKPVSVQAMWSALQSLHKACEVARMHNYYPGSLFLTWVSYYESHINSDQSSVNEWNAMQDVQSHRPDSPALFTDIPTERERTERLIKTKLREIMMQKDLENITSKEIRTELEMQMVCNLREFKEFIDNEMIVILGQMDSPTQIFEHVFLGSEWNASNLEDLQNRGVRYILNVTREIDNFFPGVFEYHNIRVYDEEATDLLAYWNDTYKFISKAKKHGSKCLVHCKMGVSRSASTVIAYAMKEYGWNLDRAYDYVKERRTVTKPNPSFMRQLEEYQGILLASKQRHNKLWRSHSDSDLSDHHEPICKPGLELNKKEMTTSADQIAEVKTVENLAAMPPVFVEHVAPQDANQKGLCTKERVICLEFSSQEYHAGQIEDELNLNDINGCSSGCCLNESKFPLDNCHASKALLQPGQASEVANEFPDLAVEDLETDALKADMNVHLLPMEELTSRLKDLPMSPDPESPSPQPSCQAAISDFSTDRIDFFSALEKFVELSQETRSRSFSHSRTEELGGGRSEGCRLSMLEVTPSEMAADDQRSSSLSNTPHASEESSVDEDQSKAVSELVSPDIIMQSHSENAISVKEIVTEIESISQGVGQGQLKGDILSNPCHTPKKNTIQELPLERAQAPENKAGHLEQDESLYADQPELAEESGKCNSEGCPATHPSTVDLEEEEPGEGEQDWGPGMQPGAKWCPGSVKRATLEFEERLRQEQEHHGTVSAGTTLSNRKNSKNDSSVADLMPKWRSDETTPEHSFPLREAEMSKGKGKLSGSEAGPLSHAEHNATAPASELLESHPLQAPQDCRGSDTGTKKQEGDMKKQRTVIPNQGFETQAILLPLPKRIEIIEYTQTVTSLDPTEPGETAPSKEGEKQGLSKVTMERSVAMFCALDENLNRTLDLSQVPLHPQVLPLPHSSSEYDRLTDPTPILSSPEDKGNSPSVSLEKAAPLVRCSTHIASANLDYLHPQSVVHLEGCTEQSSTTDSGPSTEQVSWEDGQQGFLAGSSGMAHKFSRLSKEDLSLINKLGDNVGVSQKKLDPSSSPEACRIPHSSSSENIRNLSHSPGVVKERTKEIESRVIFQAGVTKTSQMRRSASLAKLGYLDLCKDYLAERELVSSESPHLKLLQPFIRTDSGMHALMAQELSESPGAHQNPQPTKYFVEQLKTTECIVQSKPVERPLVQYAKEFGYSQQCLLPRARPELTSSEVGLPLLQTQGLQCTGPAPGLAVAPRQQHGRTHPLRRLKRANDKKRTTNPFYNTM
ncbi:protein phosphatase Slingshot homolog 2 isoform X2 [Peromyscus californicus insignis]|uniref:protein phosphatase Slingshot homolog 2 isoform X2 n=1 Tax=Peromyscus californicus insignis TaxID=564181 RepID=UPI0022A78406|nr:protein phosphatase Slingshot homolog 2 isoform X2 [Peromyscus californicus insignis]